MVLAAEGYPSAPKKYTPLGAIRPIAETFIFQAGGGRVLSATGVGSDLTEARDRAYRAISQIELDGSFYRTDIAFNASVAEKGN